MSIFFVYCSRVTTSACLWVFKARPPVGAGLKTHLLKPRLPGKPDPSRGRKALGAVLTAVRACGRSQDAQALANPAPTPRSGVPDGWQILVPTSHSSHPSRGRKALGAVATTWPALPDNPSSFRSGTKNPEGINTLGVSLCRAN
jgi:hypothetical protein